MDLESAWRDFLDLDEALQRLAIPEATRRQLAHDPHALVARTLNTPQHEEGALLLVALMLGPQPVPHRNLLYHAWWSFFPRAKVTPRFRAAALRLLDYGNAEDLFWPDTSLYLDRVHHALGGLMAPLAAAALRYGELQRAAALHLWLMAQPGDWSQVHLHLLRMGRGRVLREQALAALARDEGAREPLREALEALLRAPKAEDRALGAAGLARLADPPAQKALQRALEAEKALKPRQAIQEALRVFDPVARALARATQADAGFYALGAPLDPNDGLSALRALAHEPPSQPRWVKICNEVERLRGVETHLVAAEYLAAPLSRWPEALRARPWHWSGEPALAALAPSTRGPVWLPVEALLRAEVVSAALEQVEGQAQVRRLGLEGVARFVGCLRQCWAWCQAQGLTPDALELCVDGGEVQGGNVSAIELWGGFGALLQRRGGYAFHAQPQALLRTARALVPPGHPAREALLMSHRQRFYPLADLIEPPKRRAPAPADAP